MGVRVVISASSDIGAALCREWRSAGLQVIGTFRDSAGGDLLSELQVEAIYCDLLNSQSRHTAIKAASLAVGAAGWDVLVLAAGTQAPVGRFRENNFDQWRDSIEVNLLSQLQFVHGLLASANSGASIIFFAGGGTNGPVDRYSAYTLSKIASIKFCELLAHEEPDLKVSILGPGWVETKIHRETLEAGSLAGNNLEKTREKLAQKDFVPMELVVKRVNWLIENDSSAVSGRNFSVVFDPFDDPQFLEMLNEDKDMFKLRRSGN